MKLTVRDVPGLDGIYTEDLNANPLSNRELSTIKRLSGAAGLDVIKALRIGDTDFHLALAVVVLTRHGKLGAHAEEMLWDAPPTAIEFDFTDDTERADAREDESLPPDSASPSVNGNEHGDAAKPAERNGPSGSDSPSGSVSQEQDPSPTGHPV